MKRTILAALLASGALVSSQASVATYFGDENDHSSLPQARKAAQVDQAPAAPGAVTTDAMPERWVLFGDENDHSWLAKPVQR